MHDASSIDRAIRGKSWTRGPAGRQHPHALIAWVASRQHGIVARFQLLDLGLSADSVDRLLKTGHLHRLYAGVYAVGHRVLTPEGRWIAAVLAGGEHAVLSHFSAAGLWILVRWAGGRPEVTLSTWRRSRPSIRFHCSALPDDEVTRHHGIPVTTVARTLLDVSPSLSAARLKSAIDVAQTRQLGDAVSLVDLVERYPRRGGTAAIRRILAEGRIGLDVPREELEHRFAEFIERFGIPRPSVNGWVEVGGRGYEVDCVWPAAHLVVELDSRKHHDNSSAFENDRARDQALIAAGWRVVRITWKQLHHEPQRIARTLQQALATLS